MSGISFKTIKNARLGEKLYCGKHKSGLTVLFCPKPEFASTSAMLATNFGSVDNNFRVEGEENFTVLPGGVAHFLEHKMFEREGGRDLFADYGKYGAMANAFTSFDRTVYEFSCTRDFAKNLRLLLSFLDKPCFTPESVEKEKGIITQEIKMYDDSPEWQTTSMALKAAYSKIPVKEDIAGTVESVSSITEPMLRRANEAFYNPANMVLAICGNTTAKEIAQVLDECVSGIKPLEVERITEKEPCEIAQKRITKKLPISTPQFCIAIKNNDNIFGGTEFVRRDAAMAILCEIMAGTSSHFYKDLYSKGIINGEFGAGFLSIRTCALTLVSGESATPDAVYNALVGRIKELQQGGIDSEVFERVKKSIYGKSLGLFNKTDLVAENLITTYLANADFFGQFEAFLDISKEDVEKELAKLDENLMLIAIVEPQ